ncbi:MAG: hypothetical protein FWD86_02090 [Firmicutes bacterium]|nr:hypothetical protein [Bacillota bacterium]
MSFEESNDSRDKGQGINDPDFVPKAHDKKLKCPNCKQTIAISGETCPECNHFIGEKSGPKYQPVSKKTRRIIKLVLTIVCVGLAAWIMWDIWVGMFSGCAA